MKILGINGSPNIDGNTATIIKWILKFCEAKKCQTEIVNISEMNINYCKGCTPCLKSGRCIIRDDMDLLKNKIEDSDGVIIGSPVYDGSVTAQLKTFLDRIALFQLYYGLFDNKWSVGVSTSGVAPTKRTAKECSFLKRSDIITSKTAKINGGYLDITKSNYPKVFKKAEKVADKLINNIKENPMFHPGNIKMKWIEFLRKNFLKKLIKKNPDNFFGVIQNWKEKSWL